MPSKSQKQHNLMLAVSNDEVLSEKVGIKQAVAKEFLTKDAEEGLWQEGSMEAFDETTLENEEEMKDLMPDEVSEESSYKDEDKDDDEDDDRVSQENRDEKPFRLEDRFTKKAE